MKLLLVLIKQTLIMAYTAGVLADLDPPGIGPPGPNPLADIRGGSKSAVTPAEPVMVLNKLYDLSNDRDN